MKILVASTEGAGHVTPLIPLIGALLAGGDEVLVTSGPGAASIVEKTGARFALAGRSQCTRRSYMTTEVAPAAFLVGPAEGEGVWFADSLVSDKVTGDKTHGQLALAEVRAPRGSGSPVHTHRHKDEAWYILEGEVTFWLGEESRSANTGDFVFGPAEFTTASVSTPRWPASSSSPLRPGSRTSPERAAGRRWQGPSHLPTCPPQRSGTRRRSPTARHRHHFAVGVSPPAKPAPKGPTLGAAMPESPSSADDRQINQHQGAHHDHHL